MSHTPDEARALMCVHGPRHPLNRCAADKCMAWVWERTTNSLPVRRDGFTTYELKTTKTHGRCGLTHTT